MSFIDKWRVNFVPLPIRPIVSGLYLLINDPEINYEAFIDGDVLNFVATPNTDLRGDEDIYTELGEETINCIAGTGGFEVHGVNFNQRLILTVDQYKKVDIPDIPLPIQQVQSDWDSVDANDVSYIKGKPLFPKKSLINFSFNQTNQWVQSPNNIGAGNATIPSGNIVMTVVANLFIATVKDGRISPIVPLLISVNFFMDDSQLNEFSTVQVSWDEVEGAEGYVLYFIGMSVTPEDPMLPFSGYFVKAIGTTGTLVTLSLDRIMGDNIGNIYSPDAAFMGWPCDLNLDIPVVTGVPNGEGTFNCSRDVTVATLFANGLTSQESIKTRVDLLDQYEIGPLPAMLTWQGSMNAAHYMISIYDLEGNLINRGITNSCTEDLWGLMGYDNGTFIHKGIWNLSKPESNIVHLLQVAILYSSLDYAPEWILDEENLTVTCEDNLWKGAEIDSLGMVNSIFQVGKVVFKVPSDFSVFNVLIEQYKETRVNKKVYTALLSQSGTEAPTAIVLENTIGELVWSRADVGIYFLSNGSSLFKENKTLPIYEWKHFQENLTSELNWNNEGQMSLAVRNTGGLFDGFLSGYLFHIEVYERVTELPQQGLPS